MSYRLNVLPQARRQLHAVADWWATNRSADEAQRWYAGFREKIQRLNENPRIHGLAAEDEDFPFEIRQVLFGLGSRPTHRALFTIRKDMVIVVGIWHTAQDRVKVGDFELPEESD